MIDDLSTDNSLKVAEKSIGSDERFTIIKNDEKSFALKNIVKAIEHSAPEDGDVIILLDGDDWFASTLSLEHLNSYYENKDCWVTYGSYIMHPYSVMGIEPSEYPQKVVDSNTYRSDKWRASHLRTFRFHVWDKIDKEDFKDQDGNYYKMAYDQAIMLPLIEMASERCRYIPEVLHTYNKENPLNVDFSKHIRFLALKPGFYSGPTKSPGNIGSLNNRSIAFQRQTGASPCASIQSRTISMPRP